jgi:tRNA threonylcarbamoyladenosine biosynthesis protein TsaE
VQTVTLETDSADATERVAEALAAGLAPGDLVLVSGDVGVGKTTFVRGACRALGVSDRVTSPSFTIGHLYRGRVPVSHIDLFRLETLAGEDPGLLADYLTPEAIAFVEWPAAAAPDLDPERVVVRVSLEHLGGDRRRLAAAGQARVVSALGQ